MRIYEMRQYLVSLHPKSRRWRERVVAMTDNQVVAIMIRIKLEEKKPRNA